MHFLDYNPFEHLGYEDSLHQNCLWAMNMLGIIQPTAINQDRMKFEEQDYIVENVPGFTLSLALRCWYSLFQGEFFRFKQRILVHSSLQSFGAFVEEMWPTLTPLTVQECFEERNMEKRRVLFRCLGVAQLFEGLKPALLDRQVLQLQNQRWDQDNQPYLQHIEDVYELYRIDGDKLFPEEFKNSGVGRHRTFTTNRGERSATVYAVRCWCTTTNREYWIYVPNEIGEGKNAVDAIAWTIQLNITEPKRLLRQGDIMIAEPSEKSKEVPLYHLDGKTYLRLLTSQT